ncbi:MAG: ABC transporter substrate-binding protein [Methylobacteriaceae bacterium]|jgi:iron(III) transport system substrate-binding protein|nr:ABC transporter substrate-binding protein [Methylobacteriaceae bacterium]
MRASTLTRLLLGLAVPFVISVQAQAQDQLNAYAIMPEKFSSLLVDAFTQKTGIKVNFVRLASGEALAKLIAEKNNPQVDVLLGGPADTYEAGIKEGVFAPYDGDASGIPSQYRSPQNLWFGVGLNPLIFMTNEDFISNNKIHAPESWQDLLDPVYKNGLQMADARTSGTATERIFALVKLYGEDGAFDYQKKLNANVQLYTKSGQGGALPIATGQAASGIFYLVDALDILNQGYPVVITYPQEGTTYGIECVGMINGGKNAEAAKKFMDWATSVDFANVMVEKQINFVPLHKDVKFDNPVLDISNVKFLEADAAWKGQKRKEYVDRWVKEVIQ